MKTLVFALIALSGTFTLAQSEPRIELGPVLKLEDTASEAIDALVLAKAVDLKTFIKSGNFTTEVTRQNAASDTTIYNFTRQRCSLGGFSGAACLGGASLKVVLIERQMGSMKAIEATSSVQTIK